MVDTASVKPYALALAASLLAVGCPSPKPPPAQPQPPTTSACGGAPMRVKFYDVGQALSALVVLPDGRRVLVDAGESPKRAGCGEVCATANRHLVDALAKDVDAHGLDLLWITHPHSDHLGGVPEVAAHFPIAVYADNGRDGQKGPVERARKAAAAAGAKLRVIPPDAASSPLPPSAEVKLTPIVPKSWPGDCDDDANDCSIALRIDYCRSSVLFVGDAEANEESSLDPHGRADVLQVGHHGSNTSTSDAFLARVSPEWAVVSSGKPGEGMNTTYCHPRTVTLEKLARVLGGPTTSTLRAFDGSVSCKASSAAVGDEATAHWHEVPVPAHLLATARDGDVTLVTVGDGVFTRE